MLPRLRLSTRLVHLPVLRQGSSLFTSRAMSSRATNSSTNPAVGPDSPNPDPSSSESAATGTAAPIDALPAPQPDGGSTPVLDISGKGPSTVSLGALGPVVVNKDGTVSRVTNWEKMSEAERETTLRVLGKRNQARLKALREKEEGNSEGAGQ